MKNIIRWFRKAPPEATLLLPSLVIAILLQVIFATGYPLMLVDLITPPTYK
jgi:hypothetical protein